MNKIFIALLTFCLVTHGALGMEKPLEITQRDETLTKNIFSTFKLRHDVAGVNLPVGTLVKHTHGGLLRSATDTWQVEEAYKEEAIPADVEKIKNDWSAVASAENAQQRKEAEERWDRASLTTYSDCLVKLVKKSTYREGLYDEKPTHLRERVIFGNNVSSYRFGLQIRQNPLLKHFLPLVTLGLPKAPQVEKGTFSIANECDLFDNGPLAKDSFVFIGNNNQLTRSRDLQQISSEANPQDTEKYRLVSDTNVVSSKTGVDIQEDERIIKLMSPYRQEVVAEQNRWYTDTKQFNKQVAYTQTRSKNCPLYGNNGDQVIEEITDKVVTDHNPVTTRKYSWLSKGALAGVVTTAAFASWKLYTYLKPAK